jgi:DNA-binding LacI/PurR family transcriptional regulator
MADIARHAGVSLSTVSYALSGKRAISEPTRRRVFAAMSALDFHPHASGRALASRRTRAIALLFPALAKGLSEMRLEFVTSAAEAAAERGYSFLLSTSPADDADVLRLLRSGLVDGLILMEIKLRDSRVDLLRDRGYPFALIGHCERNDGLSFVDLDFADAIERAVRHLAELGHRRIAFVNAASGLLDVGYGPTARSLAGFERVVAELGLTGRAYPVRAEPRGRLRASFPLARVRRRRRGRRHHQLGGDRRHLPGRGRRRPTRTPAISRWLPSSPTGWRSCSARP